MLIELLREPGVDLKPAPTSAYEDYKSGGGMLDLESYRMLENFRDLRNCYVDKGSLIASIFQVETMAPGVELTDREIGMYTLLRTLALQGKDTPPNERQIPQTLEDQVLLAEVLLFTNPQKSEEFKKKHSDIFG